MLSARHVMSAGVAAMLLFASSTHAQRGTAKRRIERARAEQFWKSRTQTRTLRHQGNNRRYLLHVPPSASGALVLAFHGGSETPENLEKISGLSALADKERFIVAYPEGIDKSWADGRGTTAADRQGVEDVGFAKAVVADIARAHYVERTRVFATGPSNGGIFSSRLGCDAADTFAAIAPVIGTIAADLASTCRPSAPVSVVGVQGLADPVVPFDGGTVGGTLDGKAAGGNVLSGREAQELWRTLGRCTPSVVVTRLPLVVNDGTSVSRRIYGNCRDGVDVVWYEIQGGGHRWPPRQANGAAEAMVKRTLGVASQNLNASETVWAFFASHPRRSR